MRKPNGNKERLQHIEECCFFILQETQNLSIKEFMDNNVLRVACVKWLEIIGEATKHITEEFKEENKEVVWEKLAGMRNILVHEYFGIDYPALWNAILKDLPILNLQIKELLKAF